MNQRLISSLILLFALAMPGLLGSAMTAGETPFVWDQPVKVKRVAKSKRRPQPGPAKKEEKVPLLTLKWQLLKRAEGNAVERLDPSRPLQIGDLVKFAVTPNQKGFLYI